MTTTPGCPDGRYTAEMFQSAFENFELWDAAVCGYGGPLSLVLVGTIVYSGLALNIFIRTQSVMIPFVLALILGGTVLAQTFAVINSFVAIIILIAAPLVVSALILSVDRRG